MVDLSHTIKPAEIATNIAAEIRSNFLEQDDEKAQEYDEKMMAKITAKLKSGNKLSQKEAQYLQRHNPDLYRQYLRIQRMAKAVESQLKNAQSKEEVTHIITTAFDCVSDKDPYKEYIIAAINKVIKDFTQSEAFQKLPDTTEDATKCKKNHPKYKPEDDSEDDDDEDSEESFDPMSWSPLQEVIDAMPTFDSPA